MGNDLMYISILIVVRCLWIRCQYPCSHCDLTYSVVVTLYSCLMLWFSFDAVKLNANRVVVGTLRGFDQFMNLVVDNTVEVNGSEKNDIGMVVSIHIEK